MTDSEITTTILRQIRDEIAKTNQRLDSHEARFDVLDERFGVFEYILRDVQGQVITLSRYIKQKQAPMLDDLRKLERSR
jgi:hypothetical protein